MCVVFTNAVDVRIMTKMKSPALIAYLQSRFVGVSFGNDAQGLVLVGHLLVGHQHLQVVQPRLHGASQILDPDQTFNPPINCAEHQIVTKKKTKCCPWRFVIVITISNEQKIRVRFPPRHEDFRDNK
jgi:hypothetical protein